MPRTNASIVGLCQFKSKNSSILHPEAIKIFDFLTSYANNLQVLQSFLC